MIQLNVLSGKKTGNWTVVRRFPFRVGRAPENDLPLDDDGVWDLHIALEFQKKEGFNLATAPKAIATVNGKSVENTILRNGDVITIGSAKIQFWLAPAPQRSLQSFTWPLMLLVTFGQIALLCWLLRSF